MAKFSLNIGRDNKGRVVFDSISLDVPEEFGHLDVSMADGGNIHAEWEGDSATVKSALEYLRQNLSRWFPGLQE